MDYNWVFWSLKFLQVVGHNDIDNYCIYNCTQTETTFICKTTKFIQSFGTTYLSCFYYILYNKCMLLVVFICVYDFLCPSLENKRCNMIAGQICVFETMFLLNN